MAQRLPHYEWRPSQLEMAQRVAEAIEKRQFLVVEAGTGTGKTFAYLIPSILSGKKIVISTGTKSLQDQLFHKDIPLLAKILGQTPSVAYLKGRRNYLCLFRWHRRGQGRIMQTSEYEQIARWLEKTQTGDISELELPPDWPGWSDLTATTEQCLGQKCPFWNDCFITMMKTWAKKASLILVNHHLFMADLALKKRGHGWVIPPYEGVCFDEAHQLEEVVSSYFGLQVSNARIKEFLRDTKSSFTYLTPEVNKCLKDVEEKSRHFFKEVLGRVRGRVSLRDVLEPRLLEQNLSSLFQSLERLLTFIRKDKMDSEIRENLEMRLSEIVSDLKFVSQMSDEDYVYWVEKRQKSVSMGCSPIRADLILQEILYPKVKCLIFTSATLNAGDNFAFFKSRLGLPPETSGVVLGSPFNYQHQTLLYLPPRMPDPNTKEFIPKASQEIIKILKASQGRALVLFTSIKAMQETYQLVKPHLPYQMFIQGEHSAPHLLNMFKTDIHSVLFATASFWEGIDVPGEALSCVIIDRLPFSVPEDPLVKAKAEVLERQGKSAFWHYQLPQAILALKQGLGRLIRHQNDRGILAILDPRVEAKGYGRKFLENLPDCQITKDLKDVEAFFKQN